MSAGSFDDAKLRVKDAIDIVDLVGSYLTLRREGRAFKALCPWHADSRPSLQVNPERQSWKCWVCNDGGDIFSFVMKMENVDFREALTMLAERAGISLAAPRSGKRATEAVDEKRRLYQAMAWAEAEFHECLLRDPQAAVARKYLAERGVSDESVDRFRLGFAPDSWDWLLARGAAAGYSPAVLDKIGLAKRRERGEGFYDRFRGRVLFPIYDAQNRPVGVGGRVLPELGPTDAAKYINSPETPLYAKSKVLYGMNLARDTIRSQGVALVMEGYTDTIMAHQSGFTGAVAACGTALTSQQIRLIGQNAPSGRDARILLVLDGDDAGRRRAGEMLELFLAENADLGVLTLPEEADPCEFLLEHGPAAFQRLLDTAVDALTHAMRLATDGIDVSRDVHAASRALDKLVETIAKAPRPTGTESHLRDQAFLSRVAAYFRVPEEELRARMAELRARAQRSSERSGDRSREASPAPSGRSPRSARDATGIAIGIPVGGRRDDIRDGAAEHSAAPAAPAHASLRASDLDPADRELLEILLRDPSRVAVLAEQLMVDWVRSPMARLVVERCLHWHMEGEAIDFARLLLEFDDREVKNLLVELDESARCKGAVDLDGVLQHLLATYRRRDAKHAARSKIASLKNTAGELSPEERLALMRQIEEQAKTRQGISAPTEG